MRFVPQTWFSSVQKLPYLEDNIQFPDLKKRKAPECEKKRNVKMPKFSRDKKSRTVPLTEWIATNKDTIVSGTSFRQSSSSQLSSSKSMSPLSTVADTSENISDSKDKESKETGITEPRTDLKIKPKEATNDPSFSHCNLSQPISSNPICSQSVSSHSSESVALQPISPQAISSQPISSRPIYSQSIYSQSISSQFIFYQSLSLHPIFTRPSQTSESNSSQSTLEDTSIVLSDKESKKKGIEEPKTDFPTTTKQSSQLSPSQPIYSQPVASQPISSQPINSHSASSKFNCPVQPDNKSNERGLILNEIASDLFSVPRTGSFCHSICKDSEMKNRVAVQFKKVFGNQATLKRIAHCSS